MKSGTPELDEAIRARASLPLVVILKYPEPTDRLNPTLKVTFRPLGQLYGASAPDLARVVIDGMKQLVPGLALEGDVHDTQIGKLPAAEFRARFELKVDGSDVSYQVRSRTWVVPRDHQLFIIAASAAADENYDSEFASMLASIEIRE